MPRTAAPLALIALIALVVTMSASAATAATIDPELRLQDGATQEVVVCLRDRAGRFARDFGPFTDVMQLIGPDKIIGIVASDVFLAVLSDADALRLAEHPLVEEIAANVPRAHALLDDVVEIVHAVQAWEFTAGNRSLDGSGHTVAFLDTGIDFDVPALTHKNIVGCNLDCVTPAGGEPCALACEVTDCNGHGTAVAGCAAADGVLSGVGRGVDIIALKTFPGCSTAGGTVLNFRRAIEWAIDHREQYGITVISMSFGDGVRHAGPDCDGLAGWAAVQSGIEKAWGYGIATVAASGNDRYTDGINAPACFSAVIAASGTNNNDEWWILANYSEAVRLFAPAIGVNSTCIPKNDNDGDGYCVSPPGTSLAAPMVSGAITIVQQLLTAVSATLTPTEIEQLLFENADPIVNLPFESSRRLNVENAVRALLAVYSCPGDVAINGGVDFGDILAILGAWGQVGGPEDLDGSGTVDFGDLLVVLGAWGPCP